MTRTLIVASLYPSFLGSGNQIRAAALIAMLAKREELYLLIINDHNVLQTKSIDAAISQLCKKILYLKIPPTLNIDSLKEAEINLISDKVTEINCQSEKVAEIIKYFYTTNKLSSLFIFRMETCHLIKSNLADYPIKYLDLDELASRQDSLIRELKSKTGILTDNLTARRNNTLRQLLEKNIIPHFNKVFVASELEAEETNKLVGSNNIYVLPNVFPACIHKNRQPVSNPQEILFVGSFFYYPNDDAVRYFCNEIFPFIRKKLDNKIIFRVIGFSMPESFKILQEDPAMHLMGFQENLEPFYSRASLVVVPLRAGTGTRLKILEAFALGCPVVSTSIGAMGLKVTHGENILLADQPKLFAEACLMVLKNPQFAARLINGGRCLHQEFYSPNILDEFYDKAISKNM